MFVLVIVVGVVDVVGGVGGCAGECDGYRYSGRVVVRGVCGGWFGGAWGSVHRRAAATGAALGYDWSESDCGAGGHPSGIPVRPDVGFERSAGWVRSEWCDGSVRRVGSGLRRSRSGAIALTPSLFQRGLVRISSNHDVWQGNWWGVCKPGGATPSGRCRDGGDAARMRAVVAKSTDDPNIRGIRVNSSIRTNHPTSCCEIAE